jgi:hypothetical protein
MSIRFFSLIILSLISLTHCSTTTLFTQQFIDNNQMNATNNPHYENILTLYQKQCNPSLTQDNQRTLNKVIALINQQQPKQVKITGHTCHQGSQEYNLALGWQQAHKVALFLKRYSTYQPKITVVSYGQEMPATTMNTHQKNTPNQRINIAFSKDDHV